MNAVSGLYYRIRNAIVFGFDNFRARCQRFKRGYSYGDVWDMDSWFIRTTKPMLIHLRDHGCTVPMEFSDNEEEWARVLTEMVHCLDMMNRDYIDEFLPDSTNRTKEDYKNAYDIMEMHKNKFFELFSKYFYNLWD